jgi:hypothetical protein
VEKHTLAAEPFRSEPPSRIRSLEAIALELGDEEVAKDAHELATRVEEGRFHVACVGQFKRGKSTLLNAIIGAPLLSMQSRLRPRPSPCFATAGRRGVSFEDERGPAVLRCWCAAARREAAPSPVRHRWTPR